ncbi:MAG TPA: GreA/GreB family elongation factor [Candidatus Dojkabacteria bacterium]|jgi:transcription elongation factor GreA|nr:GreA/GreB family elongation factor [Candidatus Dojkabacteria bacterium]
MKKNNDIIISQDKYLELKEKLLKLKKTKKELVKNLEQARLSDVSEDTDAINAVTSEIQNIDQEISETKEMISNAKIIKKTSCKNKIQIGSEVKVKVNGKIVTYTIVSDVEADPLKNKISNNSPVGKALIKAKKGDKLEIAVGENKVLYEVLDVC